MNEFEVIYDKLELKKIIDFLGNGFGMSIENRVSFSKIVERNPPTFPIAAITSRNGKLTAAMLLIAQIPYSKNDKSRVLNMSTWYALPEYRGIEPVIFIKKLIKQLDGYKFTDYTASGAAAVVLKSMGFTNMKVHQLICGLSRNKRFRYEINFAKDYFNKTGLMLFSKLESLHTLSASNKNSEAPFYWINSSKKYFLTLRVLNIFIGHPFAFKYPNFISVFWIMLRFRVVSLNFFLNSDHADNELHRMPWLLKCNNINCNLISPLGSELIVLSQNK